MKKSLLLIYFLTFGFSFCFGTTLYNQTGTITASFNNGHNDPNYSISIECNDNKGAYINKNCYVIAGQVVRITYDGALVEGGGGGQGGGSSDSNSTSLEIKSSDNKKMSNSFVVENGKTYIITVSSKKEGVLIQKKIFGVLDNNLIRKNNAIIGVIHTEIIDYSTILFEKTCSLKVTTDNVVCKDDNWYVKKGSRLTINYTDMFYSYGAGGPTSDGGSTSHGETCYTKLFLNNEEKTGSSFTIEITSDTTITLYKQYSSSSSSSTSELFSRKIIVDSTDPRISGLDDVDENWTKSDVCLTMNATDDIGVKGIKIKDNVDGEVKEIEGGSSIKYEVKQKGIHTIIIECEDYCGNKRTLQKTVKIDKTEPTAEISPIATEWSKDDILLTITGKDDLSGISYIQLREKDNEIFKEKYNGNKIESYEYKEEKEGIYKYKAYVSDGVGNIGSSSEVEIKIDKSKPSLDIQKENENNNEWNNSFIITAKDNLSGLKLVTAKKIPYTNEETNSLKITENERTEKLIKQTLSINEEGKHKVEVIAEDKVGNITRQEENIFIDTTKPTITFDNKEPNDKGWYNQTPTVLIIFDDNISGINENKLVIKDNGEEISVEPVFSNDGSIVRQITLQEGIHKITAYAEDVAGNTFENEITYFIDTKKIEAENITVNPIYSKSVQNYREQLGINNGSSIFSGDVEEIEILVNAENNTSVSVPASVSINDSEEYALIYDQTINKYRCLFKVSDYSDGKYKLDIKVFDEAGNKTELDKITLIRDSNVALLSAKGIEVDKDKKIIQITPPEQSDIKWIIYYSSEDDFNYSKNGKTIYPSSESSFISIEENKDGLYELYVESVDEYGNHKKNVLYLLWRNDIDMPEVERGFDVKDEKYSSYIEIKENKEQNIFSSYGIKKCTKNYYYEGKNKNPKLIKADSNERLRVSIDDLKPVLNWARDEEDRIISIYYIEEYEIENGKEDLIKALDGYSKVNNFVVTDLQPVFKNNGSNNENQGSAFIGKTINLVNVATAVDPDGDYVLYKIKVLRGGKELSTSYLFDLSNNDHGINICSENNNTGDLTIEVEAQSIRDKNSVNNESLWDEQIESPLLTINYDESKIDCSLPSIEYDSSIWKLNASDGIPTTNWITKKESVFTFKDEGSGINVIEVTEDENIIESNSNINMTEYSYKLNLDQINGENKKIKIYVEDYVGNNSECLFVPVKIDTTNPVINNVNTETDSNGEVELTMKFSDNGGSGVCCYTWKMKDEAEWNKWTLISNKNKPVVTTLQLPESKNQADKRIIQIKIQDNAMNESDIKEVDCGSFIKMPEITGFTLNGINGNGYVNDFKSLIPIVTLEDGSSVTDSNYTSEWIVKEKADKELTLIGAFEDFKNIEAVLQNGKTYEIELMLTNQYKNQKSKIADKVFAFDKTPPTAISVELNDKVIRGRQTEIIITGGIDSESDFTRTVKLLEENTNGTGLNNNWTVLCEKTIEIENDLVIVKVPTDYVKEKNGNERFSIMVVAENEAGLTNSYTLNQPLSFSEPEGLLVTADEYTAGNILASWITSNTEIVSYSYKLLLENKEVILSDTTKNQFIVLELTEDQKEKIKSGTVLYLTVEGYNSEAEKIEEGKSNSITYCISHPNAEWIDVPEAVVSTNIWGKYKLSDNESEIIEKKWAIEIFEKEIVDGNETFIWNGTGENKEYEWISLSKNKGEIIKDLSSLKETKRIKDGSVIKLILSGENEAGYETQVKTSPIVIDDTLPPVPIVIDQGDVINQIEEESIKVDWSTSSSDAESGTTYYWRWYLSGNVQNKYSDWKEADWEIKDGEKTVQRMSAQIQGLFEEKHDGKILYFQVKAVNSSGLESIGSSNGILLDSNAPIIKELELFTDKDLMKLASQFINRNEIGEYIYARLSVDDITSWIEDKEVVLYEIEENGSEKIRSNSSSITTNDNSLIAKLSVGKITEGSRFIVRATAKDAAGNRTDSATGKPILITGNLPEIENISIQGDTKRLNINWNTDSADNERWVKYYSLRVTVSNKSSLSRIVNTKSASVSWDELNISLNESNDNEIRIAITPSDYNYISGKEKVGLFTIDLSEPKYLIDDEMIPRDKDLSYWNDTITGFVKYKTGNTGAYIEWIVYNAEDGSEITNWYRPNTIKTINVTLNVYKKTKELLAGKGKDFWHKKNLILGFRAVNGMGISSNIKKVHPVSIDITPPDNAEITRDWLFTNKFNEIDKITIKGTDTESGLIAYKAALISRDEINAKGIQTAINDANIIETKINEESGKSFIKENDTINIIGDNEGEYCTVLGVRNASGLWTYVQGPTIEIDRTPPILTTEIFEEANKQVLNETEMWVINGPEHKFTLISNEPVIWKIKGESSELGIFTTEEYVNNYTNKLDVTNLSEGNKYVLNYEMQDKAGNRKSVNQYFRYNKAPEITVLYDNTGNGSTEKKIIVWPGHSKRIDELFSINDNDSESTGDFPLTFRWENGIDDKVTEWTGGTSQTDVFGSGAGINTTYFQNGKNQTTTYTGRLTVTDRYGKSSQKEITVTVENTRAGVLVVDEYWTGVHEITDMITVPEGKKLTLDNVKIHTNGYLENGLLKSGIKVEGTIDILDKAEFVGSNSSNKWQGIMVYGSLFGGDLFIQRAQRGITLLPGGLINLKVLEINSCITGLHLLGGTLETNQLKVLNNTEYGIKQEASGNYSYEKNDTDKDISGNGKNYYKDGIVE